MTTRRQDPHPHSEDLAFTGAEALRGGLQSGALTSAEIVASLLERIEAVDRSGPTLRSLISLNPRVDEDASDLDAERRDGRLRGPLHGLPVLLKDNLDTKGIPTTAGSLALASPDCQPLVDSPAAAALRRAGAIVVGKANMSEWANFRGRRSSSGWSGTGGQCLNPHVLDRSPGGSSSGSGAAVAAGLVPFAVGTETDGSILCPAAVCGTVGVKPTVGLVSRTGVVPISSTQDTVGPIARSVRDAALLLTALATPMEGDPDPAVALRPAGATIDYTAALVAGGLRGARIGVARTHYFGYNRFADRLVDEALEAMRAAGAEIVDPADIPTAQEIAKSEDEMTVLLHEYKTTLGAYLSSRPGPVGACPRSLEELIAFNTANADRELAIFGQELIEAAAETAGVSAPEYAEAFERNRRRAREDGIDAVLAAHGLDAIAAPVMGAAWCIDHVNGDASRPAGYQAAAVAGYPAVSVPVGVTSGLPIGLLLMGTAWSEATLLRIAYGLEQELSLDMRPAWLPTVPLD